MVKPRRIATFAFFGAFAIIAAVAVTLDEALTDSLEELLHSDEFAIAVTHIRPKKSNGPEILLVTEFTKSKTKLVLLLDRHSKRIVMERVEHGKQHVEHLTVDTMNVSGPIKNIILHVHQQQPSARMDAYINCINEGSIPLQRTFRDIDPDSPVEVFKDRKYHTKIYITSMENALGREHCPDDLLELENAVLNQTTMASSARVKRRGDIHVPVQLVPDCVGDIQLSKTLNDLIVLNTRIWNELQHHGREVAVVRKLLEGCTACRAECVPRFKSVPIPPAEPSCKFNSPCYPGAECHDTVSGPLCRCPRGYTGDGRHCERFNPCDDNPCFTGVRCHPIGDTYRCDSCPNGYTGDGINCQRQNICDRKPCFPGVQCRAKSSRPYFECGSCPDGYAGDGRHCKPIDECDQHNPCGSNSECVNLYPGYRCEECRPGYVLATTTKNKKKCVDVDECKDGNNGGCTPNSECQNLPGSFKCGDCIFGFGGNQTVGCHPTHTICHDKQTLCDLNAVCYFDAFSQWLCKCHVGFGGDGFICSADSDLDGYPDLAILDPNGQHNFPADNCVKVPNSGQEDVDGDGIGDACDTDADNDGILDSSDNCPYISNPGQEDSETDQLDKIGDVCDNCLYVYNPRQTDTDNDGIGDVCDTDMDNDGHPNDTDNCPAVPNPYQEDRDADGVGDVCDNCPDDANPNQADADQDGVGDECDTGFDRDSDGIQDNFDNCPDHPNADQRDIDRDGVGDDCDDDIDGDKVRNHCDNCPYVPNPDQLAQMGGPVGDACFEDYDNDTIANHLDNCPNNSLVWRTDFRKFDQVMLDPFGTSQVDPVWEVRNDGSEMFQKENCDPGIAIGRDVFNGVNFEGTIFVDDDDDDDFVGFIFAYQNPRKFYVATWKRGNQNYWRPLPFSATSRAGISIKVVDSATGPGEMLRNSLWNEDGHQGEVRTLWKDQRFFGWEPWNAYRWNLIHRPAIGLIRLRIFKGTHMITDSGNLFDSTHRGGRLGLFVFSQEKDTWSQMLYKCNEAVPEWVYNDLAPEMQSRVVKESESFTPMTPQQLPADCYVS